MFANSILFATFCSIGIHARRKKTWRYSARKVMEFGLLMTDIPVYVPCKFKMYIFKIALVISENVRIAFLYVLSIFFLFLLKTLIVGTRKNPVLTSTHNLCFRAKIGKSISVSQFYYIKVGCKGVFVTRTCFRDGRALSNILLLL